jgi:alkylhydroperoxidase family enzyme
VVDYAAKLTRDPGAMSQADVDALRRAGFDDLAILDANAQCAHLNYVNRVANGLGIHTIVDPDFPAYAAIPEG